MDLEPLPPTDPSGSGEPWTPPVHHDAGAQPRRRWSARSRIAASIGAVGVAGAAAFGVGQMASAGGLTFGSLTAATGPSSTTTPPKPVHGRAFGKVSNLSGPTFTVTATANATTHTTSVVTDASTVFTKTIKGVVGDIKVGNQIGARGTRAADGTLNASQIVVLPAPKTARPAKPAHPAEPNEGSEPTPPTTTPSQLPPFAAGTVQSIANGVITLASPRGGTEKVSTSGNPTVIETVPATLADVTNGATVAVIGTPAADGSHLTATRVDLIDPSLVGQGSGSGPGFGFGRGPGGPFSGKGFGPRHGGGRHGPDEAPMAVPGAA